MVNTIYWLIIIPFILGFVTYGILGLIAVIQKAMQNYVQSPDVKAEPVAIAVSPEVMEKLKANDYIDPTSGKLKDKALEQLEFKTE
jgi:hypothetical protein